MFERFTERSRHVVVLAQEEARALKHNYIGTEHLLLGLLREGEGVAARVLESMDVTADGVRRHVVHMVGEPTQPDPAAAGRQLPVAPRGKKVLELALREALSLGHNYIGTEHILLGLLREGEGVGWRVLQEMGVDDGRVRDEVIKTVSGTAPRPKLRQVPAPEAKEELKGLDVSIEAPAPDDDVDAALRAAKAAVEAARSAIGAARIALEHAMDPRFRDRP